MLLYSVIAPKKKRNNWDCNELDVTLNEDCITVTGVCRNEYGGRYSNEDTQDIYYDELTQSETSNVLGISQVQVSRNESKILKKLKTRL